MTLPVIQFSRSSLRAAMARATSRRAVGAYHPRRAGAGHGEDAAVALQEAARCQVLDPVDEAVRHHVDGHLDLLLADRFLRCLADEGQQRAEGERMEKHTNERLL